MRLHKQITLVILSITTLLLLAVLTINYKTSKNYMLDQLYKSTQNSLLAISNKLSKSEGERVYIESVIDSEFDSGYYYTIQFVANDNNWSYEQFYKNPYADIPQWFVEFADVEQRIFSKDIFVEWSMIGKLSLKLELSTLYKTLYKTFIELIILFLVFILLSFIIATVTLKMLLQPLLDVQKQADAITRNEYIIQTNIPKTLELKNLVLSINTMVQKIQYMFESINNELREQKSDIYTDSVTQLKSREYLLDKLPEYLKCDAERVDGTNMIISIHGMTETNKQLGRRETDQLYIDIADIFRDETNEFEETIIARMNGTEFDIFMPDCSIDMAKKKVSTMQERVKDIIEKYAIESEVSYLSFGVCEYNHAQTIDELLAVTDQALQKAKNNYSHTDYQKCTNKYAIKGKDQWREVFKQALQNHSFSLVMNDVRNIYSEEIVHSTLNIVMNTNERRYSYEEFMPLAIELGLSSNIYTQIIQTNLINKRTRLQSKNTLRLPYDYLSAESSYEIIQELCSHFDSNKQRMLTLEISDKFIRHNPILLKTYKELLYSHNISVGIFEFIGEGEDYEYLRKLNPDYIKMSASFLLSRTQQELHSLQTLMKTLNIMPIATEVKDDTMIQNLKRIGVYTMQDVG